MLNAIYPIGRRVYTWRYTSVDSTTGASLTIPSDIPDVMEVHIHFEDASGTFEGTSHTNSAPFNPGTEDIILPVAASPGTILGTLKAVSGTVNISVRAYSRLNK